MGIIQTALIPAAGFIIGYQAYKSLNYWGLIGLVTVVSVGLVIKFIEPSPAFQAEDVDNALITGSVEGDPAMFLFTKGQTDQTGFTTGRIMVDDDIEDIHDVAVQINEDVGEDRIKKGFKSWKRNVWGLKPYAAEETESIYPDFYIGRIDPPGIECECGNMMDVHAFKVRQEGESKILCQSCIEPIMEAFLAKYDRMEKSHDAESFNADYCSTCVIREHDSCPLEEGCRCCDNTMMGIYRSKSYGAESFEAESYREFFEEIEKLMNETAGADWNLFAETKDGTVSVTIDYTPLDPEFFDDYGELFEESDEKESEHTTPQLCSLCGQPFGGYGHNPEPVVPMSQGQCCDTCNTTIVIPARMRGMGFMAETMVQRRARTRGLIARLEKSKKKRSTDKSLGHGVRRNFWKGIFSFKKEAETFEAPEGVCLFCDETEDLETVNLDGWPEEICEDCLDPHNWEAEQTLKGKVRTMSGKPHKTRKLVKDKDITAEEAATRLKLESPNDAYGLAYNQGFDDARIAKRWSSTGTKKMTYSPDDSYKEDEKLFEDTYRRRE